MGYSFLRILLRTASNLQWGAHEVGGERAVVPRADVQLGIGGFGSDLQVGVLHRVADGIDTG